MGRRGSYKWQLWQIIILHAFCWTCYIGYEVLFVDILPVEMRSLASQFYFYLFNLGLFYFHAHWMLSKALARGIHALWKVPVYLFPAPKPACETSPDVWTPYTVTGIRLLLKLMTINSSLC